MTYKFSVWQVMVEINGHHIEPVSELLTTKEVARVELKNLREQFAGHDLFIKEHKVEG
ncbi:hypothetical protein [Macrococcus brunensis]|uniref:hypothetical protein n=1 Tax=Macrococcus brunensis TaxID=198483 RepID=UPI001EF0A12F|nr:hypothetical protein [Macrococcus brunensis]ULG73203.1 hypothetical protein MGG13_05615 [Macrococcus brunensis]